MMDFGQALRTARESKGYSVKQLAEMTRMAPRTIDELEAEDFSHIAAAIYGRGFVKLYCEAVGLEPKPLLDEFMDIYNGNRDTTIRERPVASSDEASAPSEDAAPPVQETVSDPIVPPPLPDLQPDLFGGSAPAPDAELSRYATPLRTAGLPASSSPVFWRMGILVLVALGFLVLIILGTRALFRSTNEEVPATKAVQKANGPAPARTPQKIPSLFIN